MNPEKDIRKILAVYRPEDASDPKLAEALQEAGRDPALSAWFNEEKEFDRQFSQAYQAADIPPGLKARIAAVRELAITRRLRRSRNIGWTVAAITVLFVLFSSFHGAFTPAASLADFRAEMVSFINVPPPLELESSRLPRIQSWLDSAGAPASVSVPPGLQALEPVGCRVLSFRGHKVTLICFRRGGARLVHLLVVDRADLSGLRRDGKTIFGREGEWMTAAWRNGSRCCLLAVQGDRELLERYLQPGT